MDLFCGAGGLSLGAARAGFRVLGAVDNDRHAMDTHRANFRSTRHLHKDISGLTGDDLASSLEVGEGDISGIIGGPPCQGFSNIGRRNDADERNGLFVDFFRMVADVGPAFFLAENVPGIMRPAVSSIRESALAYVSDDYEVFSPLTVSANEYGAPTTRTRVFFFGYMVDEAAKLSEQSFAPPDEAETVIVKHALDGLLDEVDPSWQRECDGWQVSRCTGDGYFASRLHGHVPNGLGDPVALKRLETEERSSGHLGTVHSRDVSARYAALKHGERDSVSKSQRLDPNGFCPTLRAGTGPDFGSYQAVRPIHPKMPRVITPREAARLQGFPDWFTFSPTKWHSFRQIGSSVSPIVAERLLSIIHGSLNGEK